MEWLELPIIVLHGATASDYFQAWHSWR